MNTSIEFKIVNRNNSSVCSDKILESNHLAFSASEDRNPSERRLTNETNGMYSTSGVPRDSSVVIETDKRNCCIKCDIFWRHY